MENPNTRHTFWDSTYSNLLNGQKIWVIGDDLHLYKTAQLGTKYYDWESAQKALFNNTNEVLSTSLIYNNIIENKPDLIIDKEEKLLPYFDKMPKVEAIY